MAIDISRLPADVASLDAAWLTQALRTSGVLSMHSFVAACDAQQLGAGAGLIGAVGRVQLTYGGAPTDAPTRMICKFPSAVTANRAVADAFDMYGREVHFYQSLAATTSLGHPRCYFAASATSTTDFVLSNASQSRSSSAQQARCDRARAIATPRALARSNVDAITTA